jgi:hypothetical protein
MLLFKSSIIQFNYFLWSSFTVEIKYIKITNDVELMHALILSFCKYYNIDIAYHR